MDVYGTQITIVIGVICTNLATVSWGPHIVPSGNLRHNELEKHHAING